MEISVSQFPGWGAGWAKPDRRPIYEWAAQNLTLPPSYAVPGKFDVSISRPLMQVFDDIQNPLVNRIRFRKPPRFGGSMIADIAIPWIICNDPGPIMWNWQSDEDARGHMKEKATSLWNSCKQFCAMLPPDRHDKTNTEIYFGPFFMVCQGANINNLQSKGVRWLFNDELWLPVWQKLYQHAVYRTRDFERAGSYKIVDVSQAGNVGDVEDKNFSEGNCAQWAYLDPINKKHELLLFGGKRDDDSRWGLIWNDDAEDKNGKINKARACETARYVCKDSGHVFADSAETRSTWNRHGAYIDTRLDAVANSRSYAVNALLTRSMADLVAEKVDALELASRGDMSAMKSFIQKAETRPWEEQHLTVTINGNLSGYNYTRYSAGEKWDDEVFRSLMIDRQHGAGGDTPHRWIEVRAWKRDGSSRQLFFGRVETKESAREIQHQYAVPDRCCWQDMAFEKHQVYQECAEYGWIAVSGSNQNSWTHYVNVPGQKDPLKVTLPYTPIQIAEVPGTRFKAAYMQFNEDYMADVLANLIAGRGVAWDLPDDCSKEYKEHLKAEHKVEKRPGVFTWEKLHSTKPNHGWDCSKMGVAFACVMKLMGIKKL